MKNEPKPVQNNTLCTIVVVCVGVGKGTVGLYECLGWLGIEVVTRRSEGTLVKRFVDHVIDTSRGRR